MGVGEQDDRLMPGALAPTALDYKKVLGLEFPDALEFGDPEASVFALPVVEGRLADTVLAAHVGDIHPGMGSLRIAAIWLSVNLLFFMVRCHWLRPESSIFNLSHRKGSLHIRDACGGNSCTSATKRQAERTPG